MAARGTDGLAGRENARPRHHAGIDGIAQRRRFVVGIAQIAHRGESRQQRAARVHRGADHVVREIPMELIDVRRAAGLIGEVRVRIDQPGQAGLRA